VFKKIVLGTLFAGLIGVLVIGGINRTKAKFEQVAETAVSNTPKSENDGNNPQSSRAYETHDEQKTAVSDWQTTTATVTNVRDQGLWLQLPDGSTTRIRKQPWAYVISQGFTAQVGDSLLLTGYAKESGFEICVVENAASGQIAELRDENGRSLWNNHTEP